MLYIIKELRIIPIYYISAKYIKFKDEWRKLRMVINVNNQDALSSMIKSNVSNNEGTEKGSKKEKEADNKSSFFAGNIIQNKQEEIALKRAKEEKKAIKAIFDKFDIDKKVDEGLKELKTIQDESVVKQGEINKELKEINPTNKSLKEIYGVDENSQEEEDLKLLRKEEASKQEGSEVVLTDEEKERLANMGELTEYQSASLREDELNRRLNELKATAQQSNEIIKETKKEMLKDRGMYDAQKEAELIRAAANDELIGQILDNAKADIDDKYDKEQEEAQNTKEEKEELNKDDKINTTDKDNQENLTELESISKKLQEDIKNKLNNNKLIEDDIKGLGVDSGV